MSTKHNNNVPQTIGSRQVFTRREVLASLATAPLLLQNPSPPGPDRVEQLNNDEWKFETGYHLIRLAEEAEKRGLGDEASVLLPIGLSVLPQSHSQEFLKHFELEV